MAYKKINKVIYLDDEEMVWCSKEKEYILKRISESEGKINLYPMDTNIKQDVVDMLLTAFRPLIK